MNLDYSLWFCAVWIILMAFEAVSKSHHVSPLRFFSQVLIMVIFVSIEYLVNLNKG